MNRYDLYIDEREPAVRDSTSHTQKHPQTYVYKQNHFLRIYNSSEIKVFVHSSRPAARYHGIMRYTPPSPPLLWSAGGQKVVGKEFHLSAMVSTQHATSAAPFHEKGTVCTSSTAEKTTKDEDTPVQKKKLETERRTRRVTRPRPHITHGVDVHCQSVVALTQKSKTCSKQESR